MASLNAAYRDWEAADAAPTPSPEEILDCLDEMTRACRGVDDTERVVTAIERLRHAYQEWNGDMDGTYVQALHEAYIEWRG